GQVVRIADREAVEMGELRHYAAEIVPYAGKNALDLIRRLFRKRGGQVLAADLVLAGPRSERAGDPGEHVAHPETVEVGDRPQDQRQHQAERLVDCRFRQDGEAATEAAPVSHGSARN